MSAPKSIVKYPAVFRVVARIRKNYPSACWQASKCSPPHHKPETVCFFLRCVTRKASIHRSALSRLCPKSQHLAPLQPFWIAANSPTIMHSSHRKLFVVQCSKHPHISMHRWRRCSDPPPCVELAAVVKLKPWSVPPSQDRAFGPDDPLPIIRPLSFPAPPLCCAVSSPTLHAPAWRVRHRPAPLPRSSPPPSRRHRRFRRGWHRIPSPF
jgi:hypothetical protein